MFSNIKYPFSVISTQTIQTNKKLQKRKIDNIILDLNRNEMLHAQSGLLSIIDATPRRDAALLQRARRLLWILLDLTLYVLSERKFS